MDTDRTPTIDHRPRRRPRLAAGALVVALTGVALLAAACGGGSPGGAVAHLGSTTSTTAAPGSGSAAPGKSGGLLAYSQCMRSHGLPDFPDPNSQGVIEGKSNGSGGNANDLNPNSPTYLAAQKACQKYASGGTTPADQAQQLKQALKYATCMRSHGVTDFPDPTVVNGQIEFSGSGIGRSPQYQSANTACQSLLTAGSGS